MRVARHLFLVLELLHHHHEGEDRRLWPALAPRIPAAAKHYLDDVIAQHDRIAVLVDRVERELTVWAGESVRTTGPVLRRALADLHAGLAEHLHTEEEHLLPLAPGRLPTRSDLFAISRGSWCGCDRCGAAIRSVHAADLPGR
ncbi:hemerythrin domain-containing protein [Nocardia sp. NPDC049149]|uniref:hemerythrin domain-containing protein n=1 Tax=Nocardia sp. NPDC049149 TaxID=3364315 RepID=UPI00371FEB5C